MECSLPGIQVVGVCRQTLAGEGMQGLEKKKKRCVCDSDTGRLGGVWICAVGACVMWGGDGQPVRSLGLAARQPTRVAFWDKGQGGEANLVVDLSTCSWLSEGRLASLLLFFFSILWLLFFIFLFVKSTP